MIEDVYEPLARYRDEFKEKFARLTREKFQELAAKSGVDQAANRRTVARIRDLQRSATSARRRKTFFTFLSVLGICAVIVGGYVAYNLNSEIDVRNWIGGTLVALLVTIVSLFFRGLAASDLRYLETRLDSEKTVAWQQMASLNRLYTWDLTVKLIEETVPRLAFDPYFTAQRLEDLKRLCGWADAFNEDKSILFAQSGVINGNPFVFAHYLDVEWDEETYEGSLDISWYEEVEDEEGHVRMELRTETLTATVTKPIPVHTPHKVLIYGNDAAPDLSFSRSPSPLSRDEDGFFANLRKKREIKRLQKFSQNLDDDSDYTLMANHDFEALFHAVNRNHEVQFRLLFTPLAQTQMLMLMKDQAIGYGDDFCFTKRRKINLLTSIHLDKGEIDTNPERFADYDFERARNNFQTLNERYFKDLYFSLAPLLAVPLYQQTRPHADIWKSVLPAAPAAFWEHEAIANFHGDEKFRHPSCITRSILKTRVVSRTEDAVTLSVTAHGFQGIEHTDHVSVFGRDGRYHSVPVRWIEYLPVQQERPLHLTAHETPSATFERLSAAGGGSAFRRSIHSCLG